MCLPIRYPLVDGAWDTMHHAIQNLFIIGHPPGAIVNEWIEIIVAEALVHIREGYFNRQRELVRS